MKILQPHPIAEIFPMLPESELKTLTADIQESGLQTPIVLYEGKILDGRNRYAACISGSVDPAFTQYTGSNAATYVLSLNLHRRHLTASQKATVAVEVLPHLEKEANERKHEALKKGSREGKNSLTGKGKATEHAAKTVDVNPRYVQEAKRIKEKSPETFEKIKRGETDIAEVTKLEKVQKRKDDIAKTKKKIDQENQTITDKFDVVAIDPPWDYSEHGGFTVDEHDPEANRGGVDYPTMTVSGIKDIELPLKDNAVVFLWTTHAFLHDAFHLLEHWGLEYKATIVWDKEKMGIGRTVRMQCEFCLLAVKGKPLLQGGSIRDIIREARREHSRKPEAFYNLVETMTIGSRLDYFAREQRKGWEVYGAETTKF